MPLILCAAVLVPLACQPWYQHLPWPERAAEVAVNFSAVVGWAVVISLVLIVASAVLRAHRGRS